MASQLNIVPEPTAHEDPEPSAAKLAAASENLHTDDSNSLPVTLQRSMSKLNSLDLSLKK